MGIWCQNDVVSTSMRRYHVASTLIRRHFYVMCLLGIIITVTRIIYAFYRCYYYCIIIFILLFSFYCLGRVAQRCWGTFSSRASNKLMIIHCSRARAYCARSRCGKGCYLDIFPVYYFSLSPPPPSFYSTQEISEEESLPLEEGKQASHGRELGQVDREIHQGLPYFHSRERALEWLQRERCIESVDTFVPSKLTSTRFSQAWRYRGIRRFSRRKKGPSKKHMLPRNRLT